VNHYATTEVYRWQSVIVKRGKRYEKEHESQGAAECWIVAQQKLGPIRGATILRADKAGSNAGKFFLHRIIK